MAEPIKLNFLGTGSAIPTARRNHPAVLLQYKDENILFDCGEGTQKQFRIAKLNPCKLTRIFITHWHGDHIFGLPGVLQTLMLNNYSGTLKIYGPKGTEQFMSLYKRLYLSKGDALKIEIKELSGKESIEEKEFKIECAEMNHDSPCLAYSFIIKEKNRLDKKKLSKIKIPQNSPIMGELAKGKTIEFEGKKIDGKKLIYKEEQRKVSYIMDTRENENSIKLSQNSNVLICESTYSNEEKEQAGEYAHLTSRQAAEIAKKSKSEKLILMHLSQRYENPKQILEEAKKVFKDVKVAEDFDKIEL
jgi:ribonuclease Z